MKAAADVVRSILFSAVIDAIEALRAASRGVPNNLLRDLQSVHRNTAFEDLPREVQDSIALGVRSAFTALLKEGYTVAPRDAVTPPRPPVRHDIAAERPHRPHGHRPRGPGPRKGPGGNGPGKGPRGGRPPRKPRPS